MLPLEIIERLADYLGVPRCSVCKQTFDTDISLQAAARPSQALDTTHKLPVQCQDCQGLVCYLCVVRIYKAELQFRQGGFPGRPHATCPHCQSNRSIRVAAPRIKGELISSFLRQEKTAKDIREIAQKEHELRSQKRKFNATLDEPSKLGKEQNDKSSDPTQPENKSDGAVDHSVPMSKKPKN